MINASHCFSSIRQRKWQIGDYIISQSIKINLPKRPFIKLTWCLKTPSESKNYHKFLLRLVPNTDLKWPNHYQCKLFERVHSRSGWPHFLLLKIYIICTDQGTLISASLLIFDHYYTQTRQTASVRGWVDREVFIALGFLHIYRVLSPLLVIKIKPKDYSNAVCVHIHAFRDKRAMGLFVFHFWITRGTCLDTMILWILLIGKNWGKKPEKLGKKN